MSTSPKLEGQWLELFRAGDYGAKGTYDTSKLDEIVRNYDPSFHEAPAVIGHPEKDGPAYGWVESVRREGDLLLGKLKQVEPHFAQMVEDGRFKKRSISLYETAKGLSLRHVGFLGAQPPDVKGLADAKFDDKGSEVIEVTFEEDLMEANDKGLLEQFKAFLAGLTAGKAVEAAPAKTFSEDDLKKAVQDAVKPFADQVKTLEGEVTKQKTEFAEAQRKAADEKLGAAAMNAIAKLKAESKWIPAFDKMGVPQLFSELAKSQVTIEFSEGDKKENRSLLDTAVSIFGGLKQIVPGGVLVQDGGKKAEGASFSENPGSKSPADPNSVQLANLASARVKEKNITFAEALTQVSREHPELCTHGGMSAGQV